MRTYTVKHVAGTYVMIVLIKKVSQVGAQAKVTLIQLFVTKVIFLNFIQMVEPMKVENIFATNVENLKEKLKFIIVLNVVGISAMNVSFAMDILDVKKIILQ